MTNQQKADRIISVYCDVSEAWRENMRAVIKSALDAVVKEKDDENLRLREALKPFAEADDYGDGLRLRHLRDARAALNPKGEPQ